MKLSATLASLSLLTGLALTVAPIPADALQFGTTDPPYTLTSDLRVTYLAPSPSNPNTMRVRITNSGYGTSNPTYTRLDTSVGIVTGTYYSYVPALPSGASITTDFGVYWSPSPLGTTGQITKATADAFGWTAESNEWNNIAYHFGS